MSERKEPIDTAADTAVAEAPPEGGRGDYRVHLDAFDGPLDLLLYLIRKEEVSIYDIPIARITQQYLEYLRLMEELDIAVAGEFLVMAATLIHIKTKMLLPRDPFAEAEGEEIDDPRQELVDRLLEHQRYRTAADFLYQRRILEGEVFTRPVPEDEKSNAEVSAGVFDLLTAFRDAMLRAQALAEIEIARDEVTLSQKLEEVRALLELNPTINVRDLFERAGSRRELVITFLAVLELVKELKVRIHQSEAFGEIEMTRRDPEPESLEATSDDEPSMNEQNGANPNE
ncbi:MAG: segregation/condensation protein A [Blastocatellia bacterium]|jgi:segregation and condensation protein A|nr:segregation/condensation protein A [Blastocatellia bacterium]